MRFRQATWPSVCGGAVSHIHILLTSLADTGKYGHIAFCEVLGCL